MPDSLDRAPLNISAIMVIGAGISLAIAWLLPLSLPCVVLAWVTTLFFTYALFSERSPAYVAFFASGCIANGLAFYWVVPTIQDMSKLSTPSVLGIFSLFVILHALQFPLFLLLFNWLPSCFDRLAVRSASAWMAVETLLIRIFPWHLGDTQIGFTWLAQVAEIGGVTMISFIMFWVCEAITLFLLSRRKITVTLVPIAALLAACLFGYGRIQQLSSTNDRTLDVALVQFDRGNTPHGSDLSPSALINRLVELTQDIAKPVDLAIWPESTLPFTMHESVFDRKNESLLPRLPAQLSLLTGSQTYRYPNKTFNSAVFIKPNGEVPLPYHKQILIPFGEYIPFGNLFPWLRAIHRLSVNLSTGNKPAIFEIPLPEPHVSAKISPLICYEDLMPRLSRSAVLAGAEVLVSISNDAWLKRWGSVALFQHHAIASFRSIENRRALLRVGNTGLTSIVDPKGQMIAELPTHVDAVLLGSVPLLNDLTIYNWAHIEEAGKGLAGFLVIISFMRWLVAKGRFLGGSLT